uniref:Uncharacterized protein n=1 Tax=Zea mays TaxID=4577 RepID=A0A804RDY6_MAIZE
MRFRRGSKSSSKAKKGAAAAPWQNGERKVDGGGPGSNSRQVAPDDDTGIVGNVDDGSSRDETFYEATAWLESDCEDDFYSVNGGKLNPQPKDLTPARSFASRSSGRNTPPPRPRDLPTLAAILKAEPLKPQRRLGDLLREAQDDDDDDNDTAVDGLSRDDSLRMGAEANRCCVPRLARAISCNGRTQRK